MKSFLNQKSGVSLIAVLMFMLAATTASIVVFKWINSENFSSGSRLKASEAYQASESGLAAVQAWLVNRAPDVGALVKAYSDSKGKSIPITSFLGEMSNSRQQNYKVYLIGADIKSSPMKLKFMSIGIGRDNSEVKQTAIFSVDGLYKVIVQPGTINSDCDAEFSQAFFGGITGNTQAKWSSAIVNGDLNIGNEIKLSNKLIVTGNVKGDQAINGCNTGHGDTADVYIVGNVNTTRLDVCGNLYIGGTIGGDKLNGNWTVKKDLYVAGGINYNPKPLSIEVGGNFTSCSDITFSGTVDRFTLKGNMVMDTCAHLQPTQPINPKTKVVPTIAFNNPNINSAVYLGERMFWSVGTITGTTSCGNLNIGNSEMSFPYWDNVGTNGNCKEYGTVRFKTNKLSQNTASNKPTGANNLESMSNKIDYTAQGGPRVPDPLELPEETKKEWTKLAKQLLDTANGKDVESGSFLPDDCIYLLRNNGNYKKDKNYYCKSEFGGGNSCGANIAYRLTQCYAKLKLTDCAIGATPKYMYRGSGDTECYLPMQVFTVSDVGQVDGNFIWIFKPRPSTLKLPPTTDASKVLVYLPEGAKKWEASNKGNYFIFSDADIDDASGNATINGTVFLANGSKIGKLPDSELKFNKELFDALKNAGILALKGGAGFDEFGNPKGCKGYGGTNDDKWIPVSNRLITKLENKQISTEAEPTGDNGNLGKSILVMPRMVRITKDEFTKKGTTLSSYYSFMYLNGATTSERPSNWNNPSCEPILGTQGNFNQSGNNAEGLYECKFPGSIATNFYVKVAGVQGLPTIWIEPSKTTVSGSDCKIVKLVSESRSSSPRDVIVTRDMGGNGWNVTTKSTCSQPNLGSSTTCTIPANEESVDIFQVCPPSGTSDNFIQYTISAPANESTYRIDPDGNTSVISIQRDIGYVERKEVSSSELWTACPDEIKPAIWATVTCTNGAVINSPNNKWECTKDDGATWTVTGVTGNAACCLITGSPSKSDNSECEQGGSTSVGTVIKDNAITFTASLKWKSYNLVLQAPSTATIRSTYPAPEIKYSAGGCNNCLYHGAKYTVTNTSEGTATETGAYMYCITTPNVNNCDNTNANGVVGPRESFTVTPTADTKIILAGPIMKSVTCELYKTTILPGSNQLATTDLIVTGCDNPNSSYKIVQPSNYTAGDKHTISIEPSNCQVNTTITCTNELSVVACEYECRFCGNKPLKDVKADDNTSRQLATVGNCLFIQDFVYIQPYLKSTVTINGVPNECGCSWDGLPSTLQDGTHCGNNAGCPYNTKPSPKDGGYYVYSEKWGGEPAWSNSEGGKWLYSPINTWNSTLKDNVLNESGSDGWNNVKAGSITQACKNSSLFTTCSPSGSSSSAQSSSSARSSSSACNVSTCEYQCSYCGGSISFGDVLNNTITINTGECIFVSNITGDIQPWLNSTIAINGVENVCDCYWSKSQSCPLGCGYNSIPASKDCGYYIYLKEGSVNLWNVAAGTKNSACNTVCSGGVSSSSSTGGSGSGSNPTTITNSKASFPVGTYTVSFTTETNGPNTFKCSAASQNGDRTIGTYTPNGGSSIDIVIPSYNAQSNAYYLGVSKGSSGTGTFSITMAGVECNIAY